MLSAYIVLRYRRFRSIETIDFRGQLARRALIL